MATVINLNNNSEKVAYDEFVEAVVAPLAKRKGTELDAFLRQSTIEEFDLRLAAKLNKNANVLTFKVRGERGDSQITNLLQETDVFLGHGIALFVTKVNESEADWSKPLFTYADKNYFAGVKDTLKECEALEAIWNSSLNVSRNGAELVSGYNTRNLQFVPLVQYGDNQYHNANPTDVIRQITRKNVFSGKDDIKISLDLGAISEAKKELLVGNIDKDGKAVTGQQNFVLLQYKGFVIRQVSTDWQALKK